MVNFKVEKETLKDGTEIARVVMLDEDSKKEQKAKKPKKD
jgi:hypothetical protein